MGEGYLIWYALIAFLFPLLTTRIFLSTKIGQKLLDELLVRYGLLELIVLAIIITAISAVVSSELDMSLWIIFGGVFAGFFMEVLDLAYQCENCIK